MTRDKLNAIVGENRLLPVDSLAGVYFLFKSNYVVYVGQSDNVPRRVAQHRKNGIDFDEAVYLPAPRLSDRRTREAFWIRSCNPRLNKT